MNYFEQRIFFIFFIQFISKKIFNPETLLNTKV